MRAAMVSMFPNTEEWMHRKRHVPDILQDRMYQMLTLKYIIYYSSTIINGDGDASDKEKTVYT